MQTIKVIFKYLLLLTTLFIILTFTCYLIYPKRTISTLKSGVVIVLKTVNRTNPYPTTNGVHPILATKVKKVLAEAHSKGIDLRVVRGFRSFTEQEKLFNQGRTTKGGIVTNAIPGLSYHNYGWAVDVCEYKNGKPYWNSKNWGIIGDFGKKQGLVWGGDWTNFVDRPHLQLSIQDILTEVIF
ncbi:M15 family metallopeptidase [Flammeovirga kamogawensis]|uniref:M15 family metallopeptidase n=1 Tax=Flammeovirga kamogawensis TaxID=373891 RepID=A0ABX8H1B8_9BACT|nr:M15 family metallopeptidase [Flammeovirga kamogawensis]MBB6462178.1 hypothetical protein [Flammeovirga kamogawensis]QWG09419.1 M15 family metallopeptidase [Flammeovirga kamogawensis]TRX64937.1 M15 family metallopeptidase [Flammeovirga kamogawensis]